MARYAVISECGKYRYILQRETGVLFPERGAAFFVMLNPSTADANIDDPTIRRCVGFAGSWGCPTLVVANLYAYRTTFPVELKEAAYPEGPENDRYLTDLLIEFDDVICAWGANAQALRASRFMEMAKAAECRTRCLGTTKAGYPRHPLYIKADQAVLDYEFAG